MGLQPLPLLPPVSCCCSCVVAGGTLPSSCAKPPPPRVGTSVAVGLPPCECEATMKQVWSRSLMVQSGFRLCGCHCTTCHGWTHTHRMHGWQCLQRSLSAAAAPWTRSTSTTRVLTRADDAHSQVSQRQRIHSLFHLAELLRGRGCRQAPHWRSSVIPHGGNRPRRRL